jgi:hypothetical protein
MAATQTTTVKHCDRCGIRLRVDRNGNGVWVYSAWTGSRYCLDIDACGRRARRHNRKGN